MSRVLELNELARKNKEMKLGSMEYNSLLPDLQIMINDSYGSIIPKVNYVTKTFLLPDLRTYNIHYNQSDFDKLDSLIFAHENKFEDKMEDVETLEVSQPRTLGR